MPNIAYFISGHGFGHGVRAATLINKMPNNWNVCIYSSIPDTFFKRELTRSYLLRHIELDCGAIQKDNQSVEEKLSLIAYESINQSRQLLLEKCQRFFEEDKIELVLSDIVPLCFTAAKKAGIPSLALSNFTWCDIYEPYINNFPEFTGLLREMESDYQNADESFLLTPHMECKGLPRTRTMPLLAKGIKGNKFDYAKALGLPKNKHWALMYLGHQGTGNLNWKRLEQYTDWVFIGLYPLSPSPKNFKLLELPPHLSYSGLLSCCQAVFGKLGYGLVAEVVCHKKPIFYTKRSGFSEYETLKNYLNTFQLSRELAQSHLENLDLGTYLSWALQLKPPSKLPDFGPSSYLDKIKAYF